MSKLIGVGAAKDSDSKKIILLKEQIEKLKEENEILNVEKTDLEKQLKKLKKKNEKEDNKQKSV